MITSTATELTMEQAIKAGGKPWHKAAMVRVYFNNWPDFVGFHVSDYKTGNISSASLAGEHLSNTKAGRLLGSAKVWWEDFQIHSNLPDVADGFPVEGADLHDQVVDALNATIPTT